MRKIGDENTSLNIYVCGPTVYDDAHLGHARTYVTVDIFNRIMRKISNLSTKLVMNITDIDDKIIKKAADINQSWRDVAKEFEKSFSNSMQCLGVAQPDVLIRVSEVVPQIVEYIQQIIYNGFAYVTSDGSVYFDTKAYMAAGYNYDGKLDEEENQYSSGVSEEILRQKKDKQDFALWKGRKEGEVGFPVEFQYDGQTVKSFGRPGWHIECSTMIHHTLGSDLDIHFGGIDLKFPHHYNERLQAHAFYHPKYLSKPNVPLLEKEWCRKFMHIGHLCILAKNEKNELVHQKMSKSLKNFTTIDQALKNITPNQMRWMFMQHKWNDSMEFSEETIFHAKNFDKMLSNFFNRLTNYPFDPQYFSNQLGDSMALSNYFDQNSRIILQTLSKLELHTAVVLLAELINRVNAYVDSGKADGNLVQHICQWVLDLVKNLGFHYNQKINASVADVMKVLISTRTAIRQLTRQKSIPIETKTQILQILDRERDVELAEIGIILQDTKDSSSWFSS